jgi:long-chain acyl-CoA synthetase
MDYKGLSNLATMFFDQADHLDSKPFLWNKKEGLYSPRTYKEVADQVCQFANGLSAIGIEKGDRVVIVSENRPEWVIADLAISAIGAIVVPAYTTNTNEDNLYILEHSEAKAAIVSTHKLLQRLQGAAVQSIKCETLITIDSVLNKGVKGIAMVSWVDIQTAGLQKPNNIRNEAKLLNRTDLACFIYTSGTGGHPKGVMLTHGSILANCFSAYDLLTELELGDEVFLSLLPLSHSYEHTCGLYFPISIGAQIYYAEGPDKIAQNLQEAKPTIMTAVPRLYESLHDRIKRGVEQSGGLKAKFFFKTIELGKKFKNSTSRLTLVERVQNKLLDRLVRKKIADRFGGKLKTFVSGGAALNPEIGDFFLSLGINILQGYGQTEASPVISCNRPGNVRIETVGPALAGVEMKIAEDGEILVRGELVMRGYWRDEKATSLTIIDDWLHTGDIGVIQSDGYLLITDRKKDIIVNSGGDNIAPARVEGAITLMPEFSQAMVYGDKKPYLVGLVVPSEDFISEWCKEKGEKENLVTLSANKQFQSAVLSVMAQVNFGLSQLEKVRHVIIASEAFSTDNGMMTPTLKIRRHKISEAYSSQLEGLYKRKHS